MITSCKNWGHQGNSAKSPNNPMSSFGLSEENMELSCKQLNNIEVKKSSNEIFMKNEICRDSELVKKE